MLLVPLPCHISLTITTASEVMPVILDPSAVKVNSFLIPVKSCEISSKI